MKRIVKEGNDNIWNNSIRELNKNDQGNKNKYDIKQNEKQFKQQQG